MSNIQTLRQLAFFLFVRPIFPALQWLGRASGIFKEAKTVEGPYRRQPYLIGHLRADITPAEAERVLRQARFHPEPMAYPDPGQTLSMRRLHDEFPDRQYHLRTFEDGEVRGHLEFTPEDHVWAHMQETLFEERNEQFSEWAAPILR